MLMIEVIKLVRRLLRGDDKRMKKISLNAILSTCFIICGLLAAIGYASNTTPTIDNTYTRLLKVVEVDRKNDVFYLVDWYGEEWVMDEIEDWEEGDYAIATLQINNTISFFDDSIIKLTYVIVP